MLLVDQIVGIAIKRVERESIEKRLRMEENEERRALHREAEFPSLVGRIKNSVRNRHSALENVDSELQRNIRLCNEMIGMLEAQFTSSAQDDTLQKTISGMKIEIDAQKTHQQNASKRIDAVESKLKHYGADYDTLTKELSSMRNTVNDLNDRVKNLPPPPPPPRERSPGPRSAEFNVAKDRICRLESDTSDLKKFQEHATLSVGGLERQAEALKRCETKADGFQVVAAQLQKEMESVPEIFQTAVTSRQERERCELSNISPEMAEELKSTKELRQKVTSISTTEEIHSQAINVLRTALMSLETRYNNLTTEPIVRQMITTMHKMYPYAATAQQDITAFKETIRKLDDNADVQQREMIQDMSIERDRLMNEIQLTASRVEEVEKMATERLDKINNQLRQLKEASTRSQSPTRPVFDARPPTDRQSSRSPDVAARNRNPSSPRIPYPADHVDMGYNIKGLASNMQSPSSKSPQEPLGPRAQWGRADRDRDCERGRDRDRDRDRERIDRFGHDRERIRDRFDRFDRFDQYDRYDRDREERERLDRSLERDHEERERLDRRVEQDRERSFVDSHSITRKRNFEQVDQSSG